MHWPYEAVGMFIGTNRVDWTKIDELPPSLRSKGMTRKAYKEIWDDYLTPEGCEKRGLNWSEIWYGKSLLFDFDDANEPMDGGREAASEEERDEPLLDAHQEDDVKEAADHPADEPTTEDQEQH